MLKVQFFPFPKINTWVQKMLSMEPWAAAKKTFKLIWQWLLARSQVNGYLLRVSHQCWLMVRVIIRWYPGAVHRYPGIYLVSEENARKSQLRDYLMTAVWLVIASNGIPYLQMTTVVLHSMSDGDKKREVCSSALHRAVKLQLFTHERWLLMSELFCNSSDFCWEFWKLFNPLP